MQFMKPKDHKPTQKQGWMQIKLSNRRDRKREMIPPIQTKSRCLKCSFYLERNDQKIKIKKSHKKSIIIDFRVEDCRKMFKQVRHSENHRV